MANIYFSDDAWSPKRTYSSRLRGVAVTSAAGPQEATGPLTRPRAGSRGMGSRGHGKPVRRGVGRQPSRCGEASGGSRAGAERRRAAAEPVRRGVGRQPSQLDEALPLHGSPPPRSPPRLCSHHLPRPCRLGDSVRAASRRPGLGEVARDDSDACRRGVRPHGAEPWRDDSDACRRRRLSGHTTGPGATVAGAAAARVS